MCNEEFNGIIIISKLDGRVYGRSIIRLEVVSLRRQITRQVSGTKALMRAAGVRGVRGAGEAEVAHESCQRLIFPSVVGALIDKSRGSRRARHLPLNS